jgi:tRNA(Ile)-lysidine synthetase-like protein
MKIVLLQYLCLSILLHQSLGYSSIMNNIHHRRMLQSTFNSRWRHSYTFYSLKEDESSLHRRNFQLWHHPYHRTNEMYRSLTTTVYHMTSYKRCVVVPPLYVKKKDTATTSTNDDDDNLWNKVQVPIHMKKVIMDHILQPINLEQNHGITILLSVSGGCDSIALFYSFLELAERNKDGSFHISFHDNQSIHCKIHVVHFDHEQRGDNSEGDRLYVEQLCRQYHIPFHVYFWNDEKHGGALYNSTQFSQEMARNWRRYETQKLMEQIKSQNEIGMIVTAHHRDDVEETILMKMLRVVHITNISGMDVLQQVTEGVYFVKPLLHIRKKDLEEFLMQKGVSWREDESNASDKYLRNRVRNELIPLLHDILGGQDVLSNRLENMQNQSKKVRNDITLRANHLLKHMQNANGVDLFLLPNQCNGLDAVQEEAFFQWAKIRTNDSLHLSYDKLVAICDHLSNFPERLQWRLSVGDGWEVERNGFVLMLNNDRDTISTFSEMGQWVIMEKEPRRPKEKNDDVQVRLRFKLDDLTKIDVKRAGDIEAAKFHPKWRKNEIKLKEFLRGQKVPLHKRECTPVLSMDIDGSSVVLAVYIETNKDESEKWNGKWHIHKDFVVEEENSASGYQELELYYSFEHGD